MIKSTDKILIIAPHPDDDVLGCGGILSRYGLQCDVICLNSSGFQEPYEQCADTRIAEFNRVMDFLGVRKRWIWKIFGPAPNIDQMTKLIPDYIKCTDFSQYSHIFIPCRQDEHIEHRFITNTIIPKLLNSGYNDNCKIYEYMVWGKSDIKPNISFFINPFIKKRALRLYSSRNQKVLMKLSRLNKFIPTFHEYFFKTDIKDFLKSFHK